MTKLVFTLLILLAVVTASCLHQGRMAGAAVGTIAVPFLFLASVLVARLIGLDQRIRDQETRLHF